MQQDKTQIVVRNHHDASKKKKKTDGRNRRVPPKARMVWKTKWYGERKITARIKRKKEREREEKKTESMETGVTYK
jgi:hypothetical protein